MTAHFVVTQYSQHGIQWRINHRADGARAQPPAQRSPRTETYCLSQPVCEKPRQLLTH